MAKKPKTRRPAEVPTESEIELILKACSTRYSTGIRNRAIITIMWRAGLRCQETLNLRPSDIDHEAGTMRVLHGKGDKARTVAIDFWALSILSDWLEERARLGISATAPVFCTKKGTPLDSSYIRRLLPRLARRQGIHKRIHAHGLRHAFASLMRSKGVDPGVISKQLGHSSLRTTQIYLDHIAPTTVIKAVHAVKWKKPDLDRPKKGKKK